MTPKHLTQVSVNSDLKSKKLSVDQIATTTRLLANNTEQALARLRLISLQVDALVEAADKKKVSYITIGNSTYG